ncbi:hypothetical protein CVT06_00755 [Campylobacter concisus]|uniref:Uncharacterized protein n=1 Tax=Campylobacter concisus TaxID=199 RepID=A0A7S9NDD3_9BACT|nr:hypothetical protein [Campylobacter concisus]QPH83707.1 hypothetical protein CVT06_00755 [Campylobacter concisus]
MTNFCWCGGCGSEAWLNFTRVASIPLFLEHLIEILLKEADTAANGGVARFVQQI